MSKTYEMSTEWLKTHNWDGSAKQSTPTSVSTSNTQTNPNWLNTVTDVTKKYADKTYYFRHPLKVLNKLNFNDNIAKTVDTATSYVEAVTNPSTVIGSLVDITKDFPDTFASAFQFGSKNNFDVMLSSSNNENPTEVNDIWDTVFNSMEIPEEGYNIFNEDKRLELRGEYLYRTSISPFMSFKNTTLATFKDDLSKAALTWGYNSLLAFGNAADYGTQFIKPLLPASITTAKENGYTDTAKDLFTNSKKYWSNVGRRELDVLGIGIDGRYTYDADVDFDKDGKANAAEFIADFAIELLCDIGNIAKMAESALTSKSTTKAMQQIAEGLIKTSDGTTASFWSKHFLKKAAKAYLASDEKNYIRAINQFLNLNDAHISIDDYKQVLNVFADIFENAGNIKTQTVNKTIFDNVSTIQKMRKIATPFEAIREFDDVMLDVAKWSNPLAMGALTLNKIGLGKVRNLFIKSKLGKPIIENFSQFSKKLETAISNQSAAKVIDNLEAEKMEEIAVATYKNNLNSYTATLRDFEKTLSGADSVEALDKAYADINRSIRDITNNECTSIKEFIAFYKEQASLLNPALLESDNAKATILSLGLMDEVYNVSKISNEKLNVYEAFSKQFHNGTLNSFGIFDILDYENLVTKNADDIAALSKAIGDDIALTETFAKTFLPEKDATELVESLVIAQKEINILLKEALDFNKRFPNFEDIGERIVTKDTLAKKQNYRKTLYEYRMRNKGSIPTDLTEGGKKRYLKNHLKELDDKIAKTEAEIEELTEILASIEAKNGIEEQYKKVMRLVNNSQNSLKIAYYNITDSINGIKDKQNLLKLTSDLAQLKINDLRDVFSKVSDLIDSRKRITASTRKPYTSDDARKDIKILIDNTLDNLELTFPTDELSSDINVLRKLTEGKVDSEVIVNAPDLRDIPQESKAFNLFRKYQDLDPDIRLKDLDKPEVKQFIEDAKEVYPELWERYSKSPSEFYSHAYQTAFDDYIDGLLAGQSWETQNIVTAKSITKDAEPEEFISTATETLRDLRFKITNTLNDENKLYGLADVANVHSSDLNPFATDHFHADKSGMRMRLESARTDIDNVLNKLELGYDLEATMIDSTDNIVKIKVSHSVKSLSNFKGAISNKLNVIYDINEPVNAFFTDTAINNLLESGDIHDNVVGELLIFIRNECDRRNAIAAVYDKALLATKTQDEYYALLNSLESFKHMDPATFVGESGASMRWAFICNASDWMHAAAGKPTVNLDSYRQKLLDNDANLVEVIRTLGSDANLDSNLDVLINQGHASPVCDNLMAEVVIRAEYPELAEHYDRLAASGKKIYLFDSEETTLNKYQGNVLQLGLVEWGALKNDSASNLIKNELSVNYLPTEFNDDLLPSNEVLKLQFPDAPEDRAVYKDLFIKKFYSATPETRQTEEDILKRFVEITSTSDKIAGYNVSKFDNPYLKLRMQSYGIDFGYTFSKNRCDDLMQQLYIKKGMPMGILENKAEIDEFLQWYGKTFAVRYDMFSSYNGDLSYAISKLRSAAVSKGDGISVSDGIRNVSLNNELDDYLKSLQELIRDESEEYYLFNNLDTVYLQESEAGEIFKKLYTIQAGDKTLITKNVNRPSPYFKQGKITIAEAQTRTNVTVQIRNMINRRIVDLNNVIGPGALFENTAQLKGLLTDIVNKAPEYDWRHWLNLDAINTPQELVATFYYASSYLDKPSEISWRTRLDETGFLQRAQLELALNNTPETAENIVSELKNAGAPENVLEDVATAINTQQAESCLTAIQDCKSYWAGDVKLATEFDKLREDTLNQVKQAAKTVNEAIRNGKLDSDAFKTHMTKLYTSTQILENKAIIDSFFDDNDNILFDNIMSYLIFEQPVIKFSPMSNNFAAFGNRGYTLINPDTLNALDEFGIGHVFTSEAKREIVLYRKTDIGALSIYKDKARIGNRTFSKYVGSFQDFQYADDISEIEKLYFDELNNIRKILFDSSQSSNTLISTPLTLTDTINNYEEYLISIFNYDLSKLPKNMMMPNSKEAQMYFSIPRVNHADLTNMSILQLSIVDPMSMNLDSTILNNYRRQLNTNKYKTWFDGLYFNRNNPYGFTPNGIFAQYSDEELADAFSKNPDLIGCGAIPKNGGKDIEWVHIDLTTPAGIRKARDMQAIVLPYNIQNALFDTANKLTSSAKPMAWYRKALGLTKVGMLAQFGSSFRNMLDSFAKVMISGDDALGTFYYMAESNRRLRMCDEVLEQINHTSPHMPLDDTHIDAWFKQYGKNFTDDGFTAKQFKEIFAFTQSSVGAGELKNLKLFKGKAAVKTNPINALASILMYPMEKIETASRMTQYLMLKDMGLTRSNIFAEIGRTQFNYGDKTHMEKLIENIIPFYFFTTRNAEYWLNTLESNTSIMRIIDAYSTANRTAYDIDDTEYRKVQGKIFQYMNGNIPITDEGLVIKVNPSFMDAYNTLLNPMTMLTDKMLPMFSDLIDGALTGAIFSETAAQDFANVINDWTNYVEYIPWLGPIWQRLINDVDVASSELYGEDNKMISGHSSGFKYQYYLKDNGAGYIQQMVARWFPSVFGAVRNWKDYVQNQYWFTDYLSNPNFKTIDDSGEETVDFEKAWKDYTGKFLKTNPDGGYLSYETKEGTKTRWINGDLDTYKKNHPDGGWYTYFSKNQLHSLYIAPSLERWKESHPNGGTYYYGTKDGIKSFKVYSDSRGNTVRRSYNYYSNTKYNRYRMYRQSLAYRNLMYNLHKTHKMRWSMIKLTNGFL